MRKVSMKKKDKKNGNAEEEVNSVGEDVETEENGDADPLEDPLTKDQDEENEKEKESETKKKSKKGKKSKPEKEVKDDDEGEEGNDDAAENEDKEEEEYEVICFFLSKFVF